MGIIINLDVVMAQRKKGLTAFKRGGYHDGKLIYFKK